MWNKKDGADLPFQWVNIGFNNVVAVSRIVAIVTPASAPMKRLKTEAKQTGRLVDASQGRRTRSIIITDSGHVILSAVQAETLVQRLMSESEEDQDRIKPQ